MTILSSLFETVGEQLDEIIDAYRRGAIPEHPETIVTYRDGTVSSYNIVGKITYNSITNKSNATKIEIGNTVTEIGSSAFEYSSYLSSVTIPSTVLTIGSSSFSETKDLKTITIPKTITLIDGFAFYSTGFETMIFENRTISEVQSMPNYSWTLDVAAHGLNTFQRTIQCSDGSFTLTAYINHDPE